VIIAPDRKNFRTEFPMVSFRLHKGLKVIR
jgi:hypothetical protein